MPVLTLPHFAHVKGYDNQLTLGLMWTQLAPEQVPPTLDLVYLHMCGRNRENGYLPSRNDKFFMEHVDAVRVRHGNKALKTTRYELRTLMKNFN
jgi:hypothetical protein